MIAVRDYDQALLTSAYDKNISYLQRKYNRWSYINPDASHIPKQFTPLFRAWEREAEAQSFKIYDYDQARELAQIRQELESDCTGRDARRDQEIKLADYIEKKISPDGAIEYEQGEKIKRDDPDDIVAKLRSCRQKGTVGLKPGGGHIVVYDEKCGYSKLCPDESREESQRLAESDIPAITSFLKSAPVHTFQMAVFTLPNYPVGDLADGKKDTIKKFRKLMQADCMAVVVGCRVLQEDPLSARGDWNVHLNVMLLINGFFDWKTVREKWGFNVHFESADGMREKTKNRLKKRGVDVTKMDNITVLTHAYQELVKYAGAPVSAKSAEKAFKGQSAAPAMTDWPADRWREWWTANKGFRRSRSYGLLYDPEGYRWTCLTEITRRPFVRTAGLSVDRAACTWRCGKDNSLTKEERKKIRDALNERQVLDLDDVIWIGSIEYEKGHGYKVLIDLIPEDKFPGVDCGEHKFSGHDPPGGNQQPGFRYP